MIYHSVFEISQKGLPLVGTRNRIAAFHYRSYSFFPCRVIPENIASWDQGQRLGLHGILLFMDSSRFLSPHGLLTKRPCKPIGTVSIKPLKGPCKILSLCLIQVMPWKVSMWMEEFFGIRILWKILVLVKPAPMADRSTKDYACGSGILEAL